MHSTLQPYLKPKDHKINQIFSCSLVIAILWFMIPLKNL